LACSISPPPRDDPRMSSMMREAEMTLADRTRNAACRTLAKAFDVQGNVIAPIRRQNGSLGGDKDTFGSSEEIDRRYSRDSRGCKLALVTNERSRAINLGQPVRFRNRTDISLSDRGRSISPDKSQIKLLIART